MNSALIDRINHDRLRPPSMSFASFHFWAFAPMQLRGVLAIIDWVRRSTAKE